MVQRPSYVRAGSTKGHFYQLSLNLEPTAAVSPLADAVNTSLPLALIVQPEKLATPLTAVTVVELHVKVPVPLSVKVTETELVIMTVPLASST